MMWSWILTAVGITGLYFAGSFYWWSWLFGIAAQGLWLAYAIATRQWGFVASAVFYGWVYANNALKWKRIEDRASSTRYEPRPQPFAMMAAKAGLGRNGARRSFVRLWPAQRRRGL